MKKEINLIYKPVANTDSEEARRRVEAAFNVLFDSVFEGIKDFKHIHKFASSEGEDDRKIALPISA